MKSVSLLAASGLVAMFGAVSQAHAQDWQGFYWGADAGYNTGKDKIHEHGGGNVDGGSASMKGGSVGLHAGHNWQNGSWVWGAEFGAAWTHTHGDNPDSLFGKNVRMELDWTADARGRVGYSTGPVLLFADAGLAFAHGKDTVTCCTSFSDTEHPSLTGWTGGLGADWAIDPKWSLRGEWKHTNYSAVTLDGFIDNKVHLDGFNLGVNRKF